VENAYLTFAHAVSVLHPPPQHAPGVHSLAFVHPEAWLAPGVTVMPFAYVGKARVGTGTVVYPHAFIDDAVEIGENCTLYPGVLVMRGTRIGSRVIIQPSAVVGSDGFGFAPDAQGRFTKILQVGNVVISDDVEIGASTCIDRAALGSTQLHAGVKLDNLVQIAHNVVLGENVAMAGHTAVGGSSKLGKGSMVGGCSGVSGHISMGDGSKLLGGSFLMHDLPAGEDFAGIPAQPRGKWARQAVHTRNLDEYARTLKRLEKRVAELEGKLQPPTSPKAPEL